MNVVPVYRTVLKQLHKACHTRPHFVQDVRFLLSLPLCTNHEAHTVVPGSTANPTEPALSSFDVLDAAETTTSASDKKSGKPSPVRYTVDTYLQRPPSICYPIDTSTLFALCYADLHGALREPINSSSGVNPVAQQILRYRDLLWLKDRLAAILNEQTTEQLATALSVADGPGEEDFIPDSFFETNPSGASTSSSHPAPSSGDGVSCGGERVDGALSETTQAAAAERHSSEVVSPSSATSPSSSSASPTQRTSGGSTAADAGKNSADAVYSAGAVGLQAEMFVLRRRDHFPMASRFLSGYPTVTAAELASCANQQAALVRLVRDKCPTTLTCEDGHVSLSVTVEPYDLQYRTREHAGVGYFASAHRQFRLVFSLQPLEMDDAAAGLAERTEALVVNSYFVRLDMETMQVVEEVGYLHSRDVLRMLRARDYDDLFTDFVGDAVAEALRDEGKTAAAAAAASDEKDKKKAEKGPAEAAHPSDQEAGAAVEGNKENTTDGGARVFPLYFVNATDAPMVLKGMVYYKIGKRNQLAKAPIQCIPFGFLLLEP